MTGNPLSIEDYEILCRSRPTTANEYAEISHEDVMRAADEICQETKDAYKLWLLGDGRGAD